MILEISKELLWNIEIDIGIREEYGFIWFRLRWIRRQVEWYSRDDEIIEKGRKEESNNRMIIVMILLIIYYKLYDERFES